MSSLLFTVPSPTAGYHNGFASGDSLAVSGNTEISSGSCQGGDQTGFAADRIGIKYPVPPFQENTDVLCASMVGFHGLAEYGRYSPVFLVTPGELQENLSHKQP